MQCYPLHTLMGWIPTWNRLMISCGRLWEPPSTCHRTMMKVLTPLQCIGRRETQLPIMRALCVCIFATLQSLMHCGKWAKSHYIPQCIHFARFVCMEHAFLFTGLFINKFDNFKPISKLFISSSDLSWTGVKFLIFIGYTSAEIDGINHDILHSFAI